MFLLNQHGFCSYMGSTCSDHVFLTWIYILNGFKSSKLELIRSYEAVDTGLQG
jgi:hypothetical protein